MHLSECLENCVLGLLLGLKTGHTTYKACSTHVSHHCMLNVRLGVALTILLLQTKKPRLQSQKGAESIFTHSSQNQVTGAGGSESVSGSVVSDSLATPWTVAHQAPLSVGFSRQDYWSGLPCPSPGDLPYPVIEPGSPHCRQILYHLSYQASPVHLNKSYFIIHLKSVVKALQKLPSAQNLRNDPFFPKYPKWLRSLNLKYT